MLRALLIADVPGHILERIGKSWIDNSDKVCHTMICSSELHPFVMCIRSLKYHLIHWINPLAFRLYSKATLSPQVVMIHHATDQELPSYLRMLKYADGITTSSYRWKNKLESLVNREAILLPYTVDSTKFTVFHNTLSLRQQHNIPIHNFVIGFVGKAAANAFGRKGIDLFLDVIKEAAKIWDDLSVVLIGPGWDMLQNNIETIGITVHRYEVKTTEDTALLYPLMDVLLVTSSEEGGPCTILEAMACEVPVITTDVGHVPEIIREAETGFVCKNRITGEYIDRIKAIRENDALKKKIIIQGRRFIESERDDRIVIPQIDFVTLYSNAIKHYRRRIWLERELRILPLIYLGLRFAASTTRNKRFPH